MPWAVLPLRARAYLWTRSPFISAGNIGINAQGTNGADVTVKQTGGSIKSTNIGINATTAGTISVTNSATIETAQVAAHGIIAQTSGSLGQTVTVENSNAITANGFGASGIVALATAAGGGLVKVSNSGSIIANLGGSGIQAQQLDSASTADVTVNNNATITVNGTAVPITSPGPKGISATTSGSGNVAVTGSGNIFMTNSSNSGGYGVVANTVTGTAKIAYSGNITTQGIDGTGLRAFSSATGNATVEYTGQRIEVFNDQADAIYALAQSGSVTVSAQGELITHGNNNNVGGNYGIFAGSTSATAQNAVNVTFEGSKIEVDGSGSAAIFATSAYNGGNGFSSVTVRNSGALVAHGAGNNGINASALSGALSVTNSGAVTTSGSGASTGIVLRTSTGALSLTNSGEVSTQGSDAAFGISAQTTTGTLEIGNSGMITTVGNGATGINATSSGGRISLSNTAAIQTAGSSARGINVFAVGGGPVNVVSSGAISTTGATLAGGVLVNTAGVTVTADISNNINTAGSFSPAVEVITNTASATNQLYYHDGTATVRGFANAISMWQGGNNAVSGNGFVHIGANATVNATEALNGVQALMLGDNAIQIDATAKVSGGSGHGVEVTGATSRLTNAGTIDAMSDFAVFNYTFGSPNQSFQATNTASGNITGYMMAGQGVNTLDNAGLWNLRNFADADGDGIRDKLSVAVSDFGTSGANVINNTGTIALLGKGDAVAQTLDTTGQYLPFGFSFNAMSLSSPVQGQILGAQTFNHSGILDLTANIENGSPVVGDVLVISGGHTAGQDGGGVFVANGGLLRLNTVINTGGANSQSDILVTDSTRLGSGPTSINVVPFGPIANSATVGNGIALVEVLNKSASPDGVFRLGNRIASPAYEYLLFHNGVGADASDGNWYLRNVYVPPPIPPVPPVPPVPPEPPFVPPVPPEPPVPPFVPPAPQPEPELIVRPEVPVAMTVQPLAIEYGFAMLDTLHERVGETYFHNSAPVAEERIVWCKDASRNFRCMVKVPVATANGAARDETRWAHSGWARLIGDRGFHEPDNFMRRGPNYSYTFGGIQAGLDLYAHEQADGTLDKVGLYAGYGQITSDVKGQRGVFYGGLAGTVDMDAYTLGGYWTHFSSNGWYTDAVVQATWYSADAKSILGQRIKPDGFGVLASLEGGYAFKFGNGWTLEPQAQLVYQSVSFDHARDAFGFITFDSGDSLRGRLGLRVTKSWNLEEDSKTPHLVTAWLRGNVWHEFLGKTKTSFGLYDGSPDAVRFSSYLGGTWAEIGVGVTAQVSDKINVFATGAYNRSLDNRGREAWDGRLGMTFRW